MPASSTELITASIDSGSVSSATAIVPTRNLRKVNFRLNDAHPELLNQLKELQIKEAFTIKLRFPEGEAVEVNELRNEFDLLARIEKKLKDSASRLLIKQYKAAILKAIKKQLLEKVLAKAAEQQAEDESLFSYWSRRVSFYLLLLSGLTMDGTAAFLGVQELLSLFAIFSAPVSLVIGIGFCIINSALFYSFEAGMLKTALKIDSIDEASALLEADEKELILTQEINSLLMHDCATKLDKATYNAYAGIASSFNNSIKNKKTQIDEPYESGIQQVIRHTITFVGGIMMAASGYFMATSLLAFVAAGLIGTPIGWAIVGIGMLSTLAFFLSMRGEGIVQMFNPAIGKFHDLKTKLSSFEAKTEKSFKDNFEVANKHKALEDHITEKKLRPSKKELDQDLSADPMPRPKKTVRELVEDSHKAWRASASYAHWSTWGQAQTKDDLSLTNKQPVTPTTAQSRPRSQSFSY